MPTTTAGLVKTAALDSDSTQVAQIPVITDQACICNICSKLIGSKGLVTTVKCVVCGGKCHVVCVVNKFAACYGSASKNCLEWMADFLNSNFQFICKPCIESNKTGNSTINNACSALENASHMHRCIAALQSAVTSLTGNVK